MENRSTFRHSKMRENVAEIDETADIATKEEYLRISFNLIYSSL